MATHFTDFMIALTFKCVDYALSAAMQPGTVKSSKQAGTSFPLLCYAFFTLKVLRSIRRTFSVKGLKQMDTSPKTCCVTGHRNIPDNKRAWIRGCIMDELNLAIKDGYGVFISGFAEGTDLLFADCVIEQKQTHPDLFLEAAIPYANRIKYGNTEFQRLLSQCDSVNVLSEQYRSDCFFRRNRYMVQQSQRVIAVYDGREGGGTAFTMRYARSLGREVRTIQYKD